MDRKVFQIWLSEIDELTDVQRLDVADALAGRAIGGASRAAIEVSVGEVSRFPLGKFGAVRIVQHLARGGAVRRVG